MKSGSIKKWSIVALVSLGVILVVGLGLLYMFGGQWFGVDRRCIEGSCLNGTGMAVYSDGGKYRGEFMKGERSGYGRFWMPGGYVYEGQWKANVPDGYGEESQSDGSKYSGQFENGKKQGLGEFVWPDGTVYRGQWANGDANGIGATIIDEKLTLRG
ncbi:MAG: hypothetical protein KDK33_19935, partial [Leptospiraceae bacterium]|nr:hypothetical protein [Leptospiraceae bacterium]